MKILFIGNSFIRRSSKNNSIPKCLEKLIDAEIDECIMEGKGITSFDTVDECKKKIKNALSKKQYDYVFFLGSIGKPNGSWAKHVVSFVATIKKYQPSAKPYFICTKHQGKTWTTIQSYYDSAAKVAGCGTVYVGKYYASLEKKFKGIKLTDTDGNHPAFTSYYLAAVAIYHKITGKRASTKATYKTIDTEIRKYIVDIVCGKAKPTVPKPTLKKGKKGTNVKNLQKCLNYLGANLKIDGDLGNITVGSLKSWQAKNGLKPDGIYGKLSYRKMLEVI